MVQKEELDLHASKDDFEYYVKLGTLIKNSIKETCMDSTVEGTNGVLKERNHVILKIIWLICFVACFGTCMFFCDHFISRIHVISNLL